MCIRDRTERQHRAARAGESPQQVGHHFVRPVGDPDVSRGQAVAQVGGQVRAQAQGFTVGIPIDARRRGRDRRGHIGDDGRIGRIRVLVHIQPHGHLQLGRPVGFLPDQLGAQREACLLYTSRCV